MGDPRNESGEELKRIHLWIPLSDYEFMLAEFGGPDGYGMSRAFRIILRKYIDKVRETGRARGNKPIVRGTS